MSETKGKIILFPVPMGEVAPSQVLPASNIEMLRGVRHFAVENLRSARRFLRAAISDFDIDGCKFRELSEHTPKAEVLSMLEPALNGHDVGIISEAGCPAVADPGAELVAAAQRVGLQVVPLVGPSSILMSLMASGFNGQSFCFEGYLPIDAELRRTTLRRLESDVRKTGRTHIFIETPYRNNKLMAELMRTLSPHLMLCVATDVTGPGESIVTRTVGEWRTANVDLDRIPTIFLIGN